MKKLASKKRIIALCVLVLFLIALPISVFAQRTVTECEAKLLQAGDFDIVYDYDGPKQDSLLGVATHDENMTDVERKLSDRIYNALINCQSSISFTFDYVNPDWMMTMYSNVINDHPELFYVSHNYGVTYSTIGGYATTVYPRYVMAKGEIENAKKIFNEGVNKALAQVDSSMDDMQKAIVIHDYIIENATYDENGDLAHSAYAFFNTGHIVCAGYALSYSYLMNKLGVPCEMATSRSMSHGWNIVKINGKWYHVDCTWDDIGSSSYGYKPDGGVSHHYFLKSFAFMDKDRDGIDTFDDCDATDTTYDEGAWFDDVRTNIFVKNGSYYYLDPNASSKVCYFKKRERNGSEVRVNGVNYSFAGSNTDNYIRMTFLDDKFYISAMSGIYAVRLKDGASNKILEFGKVPRGIGVENNQIIYSFNNETNTFNTINKWDYFKKYLTTRKGVNYNAYADINCDGVVNAKDYKLIADQIGFEK